MEKRAGQYVEPAKFCRDCEGGNPECNGRMVYVPSQFKQNPGDPPKFFEGCENYKNTGCKGRGKRAQRGRNIADIMKERREEKARGEGQSEGGIEKLDREEYGARVEDAEIVEERAPKGEHRIAKPKPAPESPGGILEGYINAQIGMQVEERLKEELAKALKNVKPSGPGSLEIKLNGEIFAKVEAEGNTSTVRRVLKLIACGIKNVLLVGPAGSGKTTTARLVAKALGVEFAKVSCTAATPEWHFTGRATPNLATGESVYQPVPFIGVYERGGVALVDEIDALDPNGAMILNAPLELGGEMNIPGRPDKNVVPRHAMCVVIATANTYGTGANRVYAGRNQLDAATLNRFACGVVTVDYDKDYETALVGDESVRSAVWHVRSSVERLGMRQVVSTRDLIGVACLVAGGESIKQAIGAMVEAWPEADRQRAGV